MKVLKHRLLQKFVCELLNVFLFSLKLNPMFSYIYFAFFFESSASSQLDWIFLSKLA